MALRRNGKAAPVETAVGDQDCSGMWDGLPTVVAPVVVIRAARAGDLATATKPLQVA